MKSLLLVTRVKRMAKEFSWVVVGQLAAFLGSLVLLNVLTERIVPEQFGQLALSLTIVGLVNAVVMGGFVNGIGRFYSISAEKNDLPGYLIASFKMMVCATAAVIIIALVMIGVLLCFRYSEAIVLVIAALVFSLLGGYNAALSSIQNAARQRSIVAFHTGLDPWLKILLIIGLMLWFDNSSTVALLCYSLAALLVMFSQLFFLWRSPQMQADKCLGSSSEEWSREIWLYSWPFIIWGVFGWAQISSTRWALQSFGSTADVGYYAVLSQLGYVPIQTVIGVLMIYLNPIIYGMAGSATDESRRESVSVLVSRISLVGAAITALATLLAFFFHRQIVGFLVSEEYWLISKYLWILVAAGGIFGIASVIASKHLSFLSAKKLIPASIGSSLIGIFAAFAGVYFYSFAGAAFAMIVHSMSYLILLLMVSTIQVNKNESD